MQLAGRRDDALTEAAWPDAAARRAFFEKRRSFFEDNHADEIYSVNEKIKELTIAHDKPLVYYVRISERRYPKNAARDDFATSAGQYFDAVTKKNEMIKAYYSYSHLFGSNSTDFVEVFVLDKLADIEPMFDRDEALYKENWKGDAKRKEFDGKFNTFFSGKHADYLYMSVPGMQKGANHRIADTAKK